MILLADPGRVTGLFRSTVLACAAGLLMALDGFHLVLSRIALLDMFLLLFVLATFGALVLDRDTTAAAGCARWSTAATRGRRGTVRVVPWWLPGRRRAVRAGLRGEVERAVLPAVLRRCWCSGGSRRPPLGRRRRGRHGPRSSATGWLVLCFVLIVVVYLASWTGWLLTDNGYFRHYRPPTA